MKAAARVLLLTLITFCLAGGVSAATFTVNSNNDTPDFIDGDAVCADLFQACSFRAAIDEANMLPGDDIIILPAGTFTQALAVSDDDFNMGGDWDIRSNITITGAGSNLTILQAHANLNTATERVLHSVFSTNILSISGVTIRHGNKLGAVSNNTRGGAIFSAGDLTLSDAVVTGNRASGTGGIYNNGNIGINNVTFTGNVGESPEPVAFGGALYNVFSAPKTVTVNNSAFENNSANGNRTLWPAYGTSAGLGIETAAGVGVDVSIDNSSFISNRAVGFGPDPFMGGGFGAGLYFKVQGGVSQINISRTNISDNRASGGFRSAGGGIFLESYGNVTGTWDRLTVANNIGFWEGHGIAIYGRQNQTTTINIVNSTISGNKQEFSEAGSGGGVYLNSASGSESVITLNFLNTTISGNTGATGGGVAMGSSSGANVTANFNFCTIANNKVGTSQSTGGLVHFPNPNGAVNLKNTVIADNLAAGAAKDVSGTLTSQDFNHIEEVTGGTFIPAANDTTGSDPQLGALQNNGGPTLTHLPAMGSSVVDAIPLGTNGCGNPVFGDQRGFGRPFGAGCDKGSVERGATLAAGPWTLNGTVRTTTGMPIRNVAVTISGGNLPSPVTVFTGNFGTYQFTGLSGNEYTVTVTAKRYHFNDSLLVFSVGSNITDADFVANAPFNREVLNVGTTIKGKSLR